MGSCVLCTGGIYTVRQLVFNANQPAVHLVVTATDHGSPVRQSTAITVQITVEDVNDHIPQFTLASYRYLLLLQQRVPKKTVCKIVFVRTLLNVYQL